MGKPYVDPLRPVIQIVMYDRRSATAAIEDSQRVRPLIFEFLPFEQFRRKK